MLMMNVHTPLWEEEQSIAVQERIRQGNGQMEMVDINGGARVWTHIRGINRQLP